LKSPGVLLEPAKEPIVVLADPPLVRFVMASLIHLCEADALGHGESPRITVGASVEAGVVRVKVTSGGRIGVLPPHRSDPGVSEAELSIVQALVDLHGGVLEKERHGNRLQFVLLLQPA
jgi:hypothetical protein